MDVSSSLRPFPSPHIALNAGLQVASEKISIKTAKQKNSDIELQAYAGNLFAWIIMVYIKYFNVPRGRIRGCSFGSVDVRPTFEATAVFLLFEVVFLPGILQGNPRNSDW